MAIEQHVQQIVAGHAGDSATAAVLSAVSSGALTVLGLVGLLQRPLTDDADHEGRARAVQLLSQVADVAPAALQPGDVGVLAEFLGSKLSDWRCLTAALPGCQALLQRYTQPSLAPLPAADAVKLVCKFVQVHVQGLDYRGRTACYELLLALLQGPFAVPAVLSGTDLACFMVVAMENEADPRCLLVALRCVEAVGKLYQQQQLVSHVDHLQHNIEDLFDACVAPYFPIVFTAPKNDTHRISRHMLVQRVVAAMACCPDFAPLAIPLLSEKLGSDVRQAKEDSLASLPVCLKSWGPAAVKPHLQAVWLMLKSELMAPAAAAEGDSLQLEQLPAKQALAAKAAACLQASTAALGPVLLDQQVLNDVAVEDLFQYLGLANPPWAQGSSSSGGEEEGRSRGSAGDDGAGGKQDGWSLPQRAQRRLACIASCVAAVVGAGGACTAAGCSTVLSPALDAVLQNTAAVAADQAAGPAAAAAVGPTAAGSNASQPRRPLQANCGVLCVLHHSLQAVTAGVGHATAEGTAATGSPAAAAAAASGSAYAAVAGLMPQLVLVLGRLQQLVNTTKQLQQQQQAAANGTAGTLGLQLSTHEDALQCEQLQLWLLLLQQDLLALPAGVSQLQPPQLTAAAHQLLQLALYGSTADTALELSPGFTTSEQAAAAAALTLLASWPHPTAAAPAPGFKLSASAHAASASDGLIALSSCAGQLLQLLQGPGTAAAAAGDRGALDAAAGSDSAALQSRAVALLGQLAGSSSAAAWQVLQWMQPLVLQHVRQSNWAGLVSLLPILNNSNLPALCADLAAQQSAAAAAFCAHLLQAWQQVLPPPLQQQQQPVVVAANGIDAGRLTQHSSRSSMGGSTPDLQHFQEAVLQSCLFIGHLAGRCSLQDQRQLLLLPVCAWVTQSAQAAAAASGDDAPGAAGAPQSATPLSSPMGAHAASASVGPACIPLAVLAAARPGLLTAPSTVDVVQAAATLAVRGSARSSSNGSSSSLAGLDSIAAAVAVAGIVNKCLGVVQQQQLQGLAGGAPGPAQPAAAAVAPEHLLAAALHVLTQPLQPQQQQQQQEGPGQAVQEAAAAEAAAARAVQALAWVARGLAMQRHDGWQGIMQQQVLPILSSADAAGQLAQAEGVVAAGTAAASVAPSPLTRAAAEFFAVLVTPLTQQAQASRAATATAASTTSSSSSSGSGGADASAVGHLLNLHCLTRPLWQQKAFVLALDALRSTADTAAAAGAAGLQPQSQQQQAQQGQAVWLAVASCVSAAPAALAAAGEQDALLLMQCVVHLHRTWQGMAGSSSAAAAGADALCASQMQMLQLLHNCLVMLGNALQAGQQAAAQLEPQVEQLLAVLCQLARLQPPAAGLITPHQAQRQAQQQQQLQQQERRLLVQEAAAVREVCLMCLTSCMSLPYHLLHPHRRQVLAAVTAALDDDRRAVRRAAVLCKGAWGSA